MEKVSSLIYVIILVEITVKKVVIIVRLVWRY